MKDKIQQYLEQKEILKSELKQWVKDESIPLQERWDLFIASELGDDYSWYLKPTGIDWNRVSLFDDFYLEKYSVCTVQDFIDTYQENVDDREDEEDNPYENCSVEILQRYFMIDKFVKSFKNDW